MADTLLLFVSAVLVNNFVLAQFLGLCPFVGVSRRLPDAFAMGLATSFVMALAAAICHLLDRYVLVPLGLEIFSIVTFIFVVASLVQLVERVLRATSPLLHEVLGIYLPLITTNCAILAVTFENISNKYTFLESIVYSIAVSVGYLLAIDRKSVV